MRLLPVALVVLLALGATSSCPAGSALNAVFIGNSYTGGRSVGRACLEDGSNRPNCENRAIPGNVRGFLIITYPGDYDWPPDSDTLVDPTNSYNPITNPHLGDVPSKVKLLAEYICGGSAIEYVQNTQSTFTTRAHAGQANVNPQNGTIKILEGENAPNTLQYDVVIIQPQSTEYLDGATSSRVSALEELTKSRDAAAPNVRFILQQTWPRRDATTYNQICTTRGKNKHTGMLDEIDDTILELSQLVSTPFEMAPTGSAFVEFAKLACPGILPAGDCVFDESVDCPIWFGKTGKVSLYDEEVGEEGSHQSDEIGAWLAATVMYGMVQSDTPCYVSATDLQAVMPPIDGNDLATIPSGLSIHEIISDAAKLALEESYGSLAECTSGGRVTPAPSESSMPSSFPSSTPSSSPVSNTPPSSKPSSSPSMEPSSDPSMEPSNEPSFMPDNKPSAIPSSEPSSSSMPSGNPSSSPILQPTQAPTPTLCSSLTPQGGKVCKRTSGCRWCKGICIDGN